MPAGNKTGPQPLRYRLFLLAASGLVPLAIAAVVAIAYLVSEREKQAERSALELSRALATAVDAELQSTIGVLKSLSEADQLKSGRLADFQRLAQRVAQQQGWRRIILADAKGDTVMNSGVPLDAPAPPPVDPESMAQLIQRLEPVVGRVAAGPRQDVAFAVRVPVMRDGRLVNVLTGVMSTDQVLNVLKRQKVPDGYIASVLDETGNRVARSRTTQARPTESMMALIRLGQPEGTGTTRTVEGDESHTGYTRLQTSRWVVAVGISKAGTSKALGPLLATVGFGVLASLALSAYMAWYFAGRVSQPIDTLKGAAGALGRGDRVELPALGIAELDQVGAALTQASAERDAAQARRREDESERELLLARVTDALRLAEEAGRSKDEFLAMLGHELRNPLAPMSNALHLMALKGEENTRAERDIVKRQLDHMVRLVDDLLDVSRITSKRLALHLQPVRLAALVDDVAQSLKPLAEHRTLTVHIEPQAANGWIRGDEVRLVQVLNNVLGNALKFTGSGGRIELSLLASADEIEIKVRDDGLGMQPAELQRAFDPFFQAPQDSHRPRGGLGLGLAIVRSLVEMHGGTVSAASDGPGQGCTIDIRLPRIAAPVSDERPPASPSAPSAGKVLVVDDNRDAADTTAELLLLRGYEVRVAYSPYEALKLAKEMLPDIVVLDIGLPVMNGYELARALRRPPYNFSGRLLALTGFGQDTDVARALQAGFDAHMTKPVEPLVLLELITRRAAPASGDNDRHADPVLPASG
jgi:signal transduction histidine kinase/ActR/RegA family two-component response regulator